MALTKDQRLHLLQRITTHQGGLQYPPPPEMPAKVKAAKELLVAYERVQTEERKAYTTKLIEASKKVREAVEFANNPDEALAAVKQFEALNP